MRRRRGADVRSVSDPLPDRLDHYELLGVSRDAPVEEIILAHRLVVRTILAHPELAGDDWNLDLAEHAFHVLSHADLRADYDRWLAEREGRPPVVLAPRAYLTTVLGQPQSTSTALVPVAPRAVFPLLTPTPQVAPSEPVPTTPASEAADRPRERRALTRLRREGQVAGRLADGRSFTATLRDVSPLGLSFVTALVLEVGDEIELRSEALLATSIVRNCRPLDEEPDRHVVGVEFRRVHFRDQRGTFLSTSA
jgi:hypothetical protein